MMRRELSRRRQAVFERVLAAGRAALRPLAWTVLGVILVAVLGWPGLWGRVTLPESPPPIAAASDPAFSAPIRQAALAPQTILSPREAQDFGLDPESLAAAPSDTAEAMPDTTAEAEADDSAAPVGPAVAQVVRVRRGDTLIELLLRHGVSRAEAHEAATALREVMDLRALKPGQEITLSFAQPGGESEGWMLKAAQITPRPDHDVSLSRDEEGKFSAERKDKDLTQQLAFVEGAVRSSLFEAGTESGVPAKLMVELIRAFSYDVDFQRDIQPGDRFAIAFERFVDESGKAVQDGEVLFGALTLSGVTRRVYRFQAANGLVDYYNEKGESVRKALLRTPIDGARLTSGFGNRHHPILGYTAFHRGVDFGAGIGTPIQAAGDGAVEQAGWNGAYGNYVRIRHNGEYSTAYAHMSQIASKLKVGQPIRQGQVIGYVGSTGRSTGPHLHYEILRRGTQINPVGVKFPTGRKLEGTEQAQYQRVLKGIDQQIAAAAAEAKVARK